MFSSFKSQRGFTLIELLVVIAIIALLSSIVIASLTASRNKAKTTTALSQIDQIYKAFLATTFQAGTSTFVKTVTAGEAYPNATDQLIWYMPDCSTPLNATTGDDRPNGEYVRQFPTALSTYMPNVPLDPWGKPYWVDAAYNCTAGEADGCVAGSAYYAIGSGGPNGSAPNIYDADNVVRTYCKHP